MSNNYNSTLQSNNTDLQAILNTINELPNAGGSDPVLQDKTVTPTTSKQTVTADSGYDGLDTVTVNAIPTAYVKPISTKTATTYTPTTSNQTIAAGTYCSGIQTIKGDANLVASNIVSGKSIFGVAGTATTGNSGYFPHGRVWIKGNLTSHITGIRYANGVWVSGVVNQGFYYSTDGKTWTQSNITNGTMRALYNANGLWVASSYIEKNGFIYYSIDGKTWTQGTLPDNDDIFTIHNANGIWVASGVIYSSSGFEKDINLYYSTDGKNWTNSCEISDRCDILYYANGLWIAAPVNTGRMYYSSDGKAWTKSSLRGCGYSNICNANGLWIASIAVTASTFKQDILISTNGIDWTAKTPFGGVGCGKVYHANGLWIASAVTHGLYYSIDGTTWTQSNLTTATYDTIHNANGLWIAASSVSGGNDGIYYSTDGKTWTQSNITSGYFHYIDNANDTWVVGGSTGIYYSVS